MRVYAIPCLLLLLQGGHARAESPPPDPRAEVQRRVDALAASIQPQGGIWRLEKWHVSGYHRDGDWQRIEPLGTEWSEKRTGKGVRVSFVSTASAEDALKELARSRKTDTGDSGTPCKGLVENCFAWRTQLKDDDIVHFRFVVDTVWIGVTALREETALAFAREIIDWLKKDAEKEAAKR